MLERETGRRGLVHVIGTFTSSHLQDLLEEIPGGEIVLDMAQAHRVEPDALCLMARLPRGRCRVVDAPKWLRFRMEQEQNRT